MSPSRCVPLPETLDLTGLWSSPDQGFLWESLQIFRRPDSEHPHDYWVVHAWGACLASSGVYASARLDRETGCLEATPAARARLSSRWWVEVPGGSPLLLDARTRDRAHQQGWVSGGRWTASRTILERDLFHLSLAPGVLVCQEATEEAALRAWPLPHGGWMQPARRLQGATCPLPTGDGNRPRRLSG